jgi:hypothetical protein
MRDVQLLAYAVLAVLAACQTGMVSGRQANLAPTQQHTVDTGAEAAKRDDIVDTQQYKAAPEPTRQQPRDVRRLMEKTQAASAAADRSAAELLEHLPNVNNVKFRKIGKLFSSLLSSSSLQVAISLLPTVGSQVGQQYLKSHLSSRCRCSTLSSCQTRRKIA